MTIRNVKFKNVISSSLVMSQFFSKPVQNTAINWHTFNPPDRFEYDNYVAGSLEMFHCSGSLAKPQFSNSIAVITTHGLMDMMETVHGDVNL